jgi:hypothetical protein
VRVRAPLDFTRAGRAFDSAFARDEQPAAAAAG